MEFGGSANHLVDKISRIAVVLVCHTRTSWQSEHDYSRQYTLLPSLPFEPSAVQYGLETISSHGGDLMFLDDRLFIYSHSHLAWPMNHSSLHCHQPFQAQMNAESSKHVSFRNTQSIDGSQHRRPSCTSKARVAVEQDTTFFTANAAVVPPRDPWANREKTLFPAGDHRITGLASRGPLQPAVRRLSIAFFTAYYHVRGHGVKAKGQRAKQNNGRSREKVDSEFYY